MSIRPNIRSGLRPTAIEIALDESPEHWETLPSGLKIWLNESDQGMAVLPIKSVAFKYTIVKMRGEI